MNYENVTLEMAVRMYERFNMVAIIRDGKLVDFMEGEKMNE